MKKMISIILSAALLFTGVIATAYVDIPDGEWYTQDVLTAIEKGWFAGYEDNTFKPEGTITRCEAARVLVTYKYGDNLPQVSPNLYADVNESEWYAVYCNISKADNITPAGSNFYPNVEITRQDALASIVKVSGIDYKNADLSLLKQFTDASEVSQENAKYFAAAIEKKMIQGYPDGTVKPQGTITRAEFATLMLRMDEQKKASVISSSAVPITEEEVRCTHNGLSIYGKMTTPNDGKQKHPIVIFSHGFNGGNQFSIAYAQALAAKGVASYAFDFPGGSNGSKSDGSMLDMSVLTEAADLNAVIDYIKTLDYVDTDNLFLLGESQGGLVSALVASERKDEVQGLILFYPALLVPEMVRSMFKSVDEIPDTTTMLGATVGKKYFEDIFDLDVYKEIAEYTKSVLIIHGDKDSLVPLAYSEKAVKTYNSAKLVTIKGADHGGGFWGNARLIAIDSVLDFVSNHTTDVE